MIACHSLSRVVPGVPSGHLSSDNKSKEDADAKYKAESKRKQRTLHVIIQSNNLRACTNDDGNQVWTGCTD